MRFAGFVLKPAKFQEALSKHEKTNGENFMHELCRFAGLFSIVPTKNTRFFHWTEHDISGGDL